MREFETRKYSKTLESAFASGKVDLNLVMQYDCNKRIEDFDSDTFKLGFVATVESEDVKVEGTLSRKGNVLAAYCSYSDFFKLVSDPQIIKVEFCEDIQLLLSNRSEEITLTSPCSVTVSDEWDSPAYDSFWHSIEREFQRKIKRLERVGKKVKIAST